MSTIYANQSVAFTDIDGNTASLIPGTGLVIQTPTQTLTTNVDGFTNGTESLLFTDLYAGVEKMRSVKFDTSTHTTLSVVDTIEIQDYDTLPTKTTTITPNGINASTVENFEIICNGSIQLTPNTGAGGTTNIESPVFNTPVNINGYSLENCNTINTPYGFALNDIGGGVIFNSTGSIELAPNDTTGDLILTGTNLESVSSGGNSGKHLRIKLNGTYYKIKLEKDV